MTDEGGAEFEDDGAEEHFLAVTDVANAFERMLTEFARETDRGAVLIAADIVADTLGSIISELRSTDFDKSHIKRLMRYPGFLATFSARADVAFLAGFIDANAYASIDKLRQLRNKAAHSQTPFDLLSYQDTLRAISDLGPGTSTAVNRFALEALLRQVVNNLFEAGVKIEMEIGSNPFSTARDALDELQKRPEAMKALEGRLPRMELAFAIWLLLGLLRARQKAVLTARTKPLEEAK